jgi:hydroxyacylglutathione hydrolase
MASREFSTLGYERQNNPVLQKNRQDFIRQKVIEHHYQPPYFKQMEIHNRDGVAFRLPPQPRNMSPDEFDQAMRGGMIVLDARSTEAFAGGFIPGSLFIPLKMIPAFAGWFLPYDKPIGLVVEESDHLPRAVENLFRIGYDNVIGALSRGMPSWETSGRAFDTVGVIDARSLARRIERNEPFILLDVRSVDEFEEGHLPNARHIYVGDLPRHLDELSRTETITTFCGSGRRAMIAASLLKAAGFERVENCHGSMRACKVIGCPVLT